MLLNDRQIERYSRQIVLPEIGARGQRRLLDARVGVIGAGVAAERTVAYLSAAGIGRLVVPAGLAALVDRAEGDVAVEISADADVRATLDALVVVGPDTPAPTPARRRFWIDAGRAAEVPPCAACARRVLGPAPSCEPTLAGVRDALLGTVVATEVVKRLLEIGVALEGRVLTYDPADSEMHFTPVASSGCPSCATGA